MNFCHVMKPALWGYRKTEVDRYVKELLEQNNMMLSEMLSRIAELEEEKKQLELASSILKRDLNGYLDEILRMHQFTDIVESMSHHEILHLADEGIKETSDKFEITKSIEELTEIIRQEFGNLSTKVDTLSAKTKNAFFVQSSDSKFPKIKYTASGEEEPALENEAEDRLEADEVSKAMSKSPDFSGLYGVLHSNISEQEVFGDSNSFFGTAVNEKPRIRVFNTGMYTYELMEYAKGMLDKPAYNSFFENGLSPGHVIKIREDFNTDKKAEAVRESKPDSGQEISYGGRKETEEHKEEHRDERRAEHQREEIDEDAVWIRQRYIVGKVAGEDLYDRDGRLIVARNSRITSRVVAEADKAGKLPELIVHMIMDNME